MTLPLISLFRFALPALALVAVPAQAVVQQADACLTQEEAHGLVLYALPEISRQLSQGCGPSLPANAYLLRSGSSLTARFETAALTAAPIARTAFSKVAGLSTAKFSKLSDNMMRDLIGAGIGAAMAKGIKPAECRIINDVLEQLDPLPAENVAAVLGIALREGGKGEKSGKSPFRICGTEESQ